MNTWFLFCDMPEPLNSGKIIIVMFFFLKGFLVFNLDGIHCYTVLAGPYMYLFIYIYIYIYLFIYIHIYMFVIVFTCINIHICIYTYICLL